LKALSANGDHPLLAERNVRNALLLYWLDYDEAAVFKANAHPTMEEIDGTMHGNICCCGALTSYLVKQLN